MTAFTNENRDHQLDLVHVGRILDYNLWNDGVFSLDQRTEIVSEVIDEVFHLKNSVAKHRPEEEFARSARGSRERPSVSRRQPGSWTNTDQRSRRGTFGGGCRRL